MTLFDWIVVLIILVSAAVAASQGFLREVISLAGLIVGFTLALWNYCLLAAPLARHISSEPVADAVAFLLIALGVMILAGLLGRAAAALARSIGLGWLDRLLGALFGVLRGCVLVVIVIIALAAFMPGIPWLRGSRLAPYFLSWANTFSAGGPAALRLKIRNGVTEIKNSRENWIELGLHPRAAAR